MEYRLTFEMLKSMTEPEIFASAYKMVDNDDVEMLDESHNPGVSKIEAIVNGVFVVVALKLIGDGRAGMNSACTVHPRVALCVHSTAVLQYVTDFGEEFVVTGAPTKAKNTPTVPSWKETLSRLVPPPEPESAVTISKLGLMLKAEVVKSYWGRSRIEVSARPVRPGARTAWVQTGVSWRDLPYDEVFDRRQRLAVMELYRLCERDPDYLYQYGTHVDWIPLAHLPGLELAKAFERIRATGVTIVNAGSSRLPVHFHQEPAQGFVDIIRTDTGLDVTATILGPDGKKGPILPFGEPATLALTAKNNVLKDQEIEMALFGGALSPAFLSLVESDSALKIPNKEIEDFEKNFLNGLRRMGQIRSTDSSYQIPEPARPVLQIFLDSVLAPLRLAYRWNYVDRGPRQHETEMEILESIQDKVGDKNALGEPLGGIFPSATLNRSESIEFVLETLPQLREHPDVQVKEQTAVPEYRLTDGKTQVSVNVSEPENDWFDLNISVQLDERQIPFVQLFAALNDGETFLELDDHEVIRIDGPDFDQLRQLISEAGELAESHSDGVRMHRLSIDWWQELLNLGIIEAQENEWLKVMSQLTAGNQIEELQVPASFTATLRDYQLHGASWLHFLRTHGLGGVLADDMGLGKTVQLLAALEAARIDNPNQKFLVVAPTTVAGNWLNEAVRFAPEMKSVLVGETAKKRGSSVAEHVADAQLVITSFALFRLDFESFDELEYSVLILDEAQQLKNHTSKGYKQARQMAVPCKFVVTGTPVENNLVELWALTSLAAPGLLGGLKAFKDNYAKPISSGDTPRLERLKSRLRPFLLRRTKEQVAKDLPAKTEQILQVELEPAHRKAYDRRFARVRQEILGLVKDVDSNRFKILQSLTLLRQLALDPSLVDEGNGPSAKLELLKELLSDAVSEGHKVLVFSQFTGFLKKASEAAAELGLTYGYLDGSTTQKNRKKLIDQFGEGDFPVFFISLKAGGFGINLTTADYCILLDPWWNPAAEAQAVDRAHRIGQTKPVYVYRLVAENTIESKVLALQEKKTRMFNDVLGESTDAAASTSLSAEDFLSLIE